jgi:hypothetical protein
MGRGGVWVILERYVSRTVFWQGLAEYSSGSLVSQTAEGWRYIVAESWDLRIRLAWLLLAWLLAGYCDRFVTPRAMTPT